MKKAKLFHSKYSVNPVKHNINGLTAPGARELRRKGMVKKVKRLKDRRDKQGSYDSYASRPAVGDIKNEGEQRDGSRDLV